VPIRPENRDRYPANWPEISRHIRFVRAGGGRCECRGECGRGTHHGPTSELSRCPNRHGQRDYTGRSTVVLTTAHLNHRPEDCAPENLRGMCQGCHLWYDRDHHAETRASRMLVSSSPNSSSTMADCSRTSRPPARKRPPNAEDSNEQRCIPAPTTDRRGYPGQP